MQQRLHSAPTMQHALTCNLYDLSRTNLPRCNGAQSAMPKRVPAWHGEPRRRYDFLNVERKSEHLTTSVPDFSTTKLGGVGGGVSAKASWLLETLEYFRSIPHCGVLS